jgi:hypothetical protein
MQLHDLEKAYYTETPTFQMLGIPDELHENV